MLQKILQFQIKGIAVPRQEIPIVNMLLLRPPNFQLVQSIVSAIQLPLLLYKLQANCTKRCSQKR